MSVLRLTGLLELGTIWMKLYILAVYTGDARWPNATPSRAGSLLPNYRKNNIVLPLWYFNLYVTIKNSGLIHF